MAAIHQTARIDASTRVVIVGDIHGCLDELLELLDKVAFDEARDALVFVGDLVNKGPKSCEVVRFAREHRVLCVRGNHDDAALSQYHAWRREPSAAPPPKYDYVRRLTDEDVAFLEQLPFTLTLPDHGALVVHAGLVPGLPLAQQDPGMMYKMRWLVRPADGGAWRAAETKPDDAAEALEVRAWATQWTGPLHVVFGHDAVAGLQLTPFATGIDTGCCYGRQLSACILPTREIVSVQARAAYAPMTAAPQR